MGFSWADKKRNLNHTFWLFVLKRCMSCTPRRSLGFWTPACTMRKLLQKISEDRKAVVGSSLTIPDDLVFEILLRLPCKSIARCRCLSKLWASIFDSQDFTDRYLTISSARPQLLFAFQEYGKVFFFSTPQNHEHDNSSPITASYHMSFPVSRVREIYIVLSVVWSALKMNGS